ncbi:MAG: hypothetical protein P8M80_05400 [Pirellulaceae bacterium]|nr:hypothetical protein [Pirellulaceae bacterium]
MSRKRKKRKPGEREKGLPGSDSKSNTVDATGSHLDSLLGIDAKKSKSYARIKLYLVGLGMVLVLAGGYWGYGAYNKVILEEACEAAKSSGDWAELELKAREWAIWDPDNEKPWLYLATAAQEVGANQELLKYLSLMPESGPSPAFMLQSDILFQSNKAREAAEIFAMLVAREPASKEAHRRLNFYYAMTRQRTELIRESRRAIQDGADIIDSFVYLVGADWLTFTNGYQVTMAWAQAYPGDNEIFEIAAAMHLIAAGVDQSMEEVDEKLKEQLSKSSEIIANLKAKYPNNREILVMEMVYHIHRANARKVGELLNQLTIDVEDDSRFWRFKGWFYSYCEDWTQAEAAYRKCLELYPYDWQCRHELSLVLRQLNKPEELKAIQESAYLGKDVMRDVLQADNIAAISLKSMEKIIQYARLCGEGEMAKKLSDRLYER